MNWTKESIPDQSGKIAIVTGSNSGIGFVAAQVLAEHGAHVILACRNPTKAREALERIREELPAASVESGRLDLSDLSSVRGFAEDFLSHHDRLDLLINNAGVMVPPERQTTKDGFELQLGVNHLGHFALTGYLLDRLRATAGSRVVVVSSAAHRFGKMDFEDPNWEKRSYKKWPSYGQSKLANLLFLLELDARLRAAGAPVLAAGAHPGWTATNLQRNTATARFMNRFLAMEPWQGALPTLRAAADPDLRGGEYFGPRSLFEMRGYPVEVDRSDDAKARDDAARLWELSARLTGVEYPI